MENQKEFPKNFMWGASTSAYQCEGAANEYGKKDSQQDAINREIKAQYGYADASVTCDHYHHYKEDVAYMAEMGFSSYRFSVNWSRIFPDGTGEPNPEGVQFYHDLFSELKKYRITPIATMYHYDLPMALVKKYGGWGDRQVVADFEYFARFILKEYKDEVKYWLTINEQSIVVNYIDRKNFVSPEDQFNPRYRWQCNHHMNMANALACIAVHELVPDGKVGAALDTAPVYPASSDPYDVMAARNANDMKNWFYMDAYFKGIYNAPVQRYLEKEGLAPVILEGDMEIMKRGAECFDFLAINYYQSACARRCPEGVSRNYKENNKTGKDGHVVYETQPGFYKMCKNETLKETDWSFPIDPQGLEYMLVEIYERYGKPVMITENGLGAYDELVDGRIHDPYRISYIKEHIKAIKRAIDKGVPVLAYNPWSVMDLLSTSNGMEKRYGFLYVDRTNDDPKECKRYRKDSFYWYRNVIRSNGVNLD